MTIAVLPSPVNDSDLVALSLQGDREAYAAIVARYQSVICALAYASCGDVHQSEDLAQETFIAAWKDLGGLKDPSRLRAWLRGIARKFGVRVQGNYIANAGENRKVADFYWKTIKLPAQQFIEIEQLAALAFPSHPQFLPWIVDTVPMKQEKRT